MKTSRGLSKDNNSKKQTLETLCKRLRKVTLLREVELEDLLLHIGSVIYPSKTFQKNKATFINVENSQDNNGQIKAK